jgi:hypothetical protein
MQGMSERLHALLARAPRYPRRLVCLTEETTETLYHGKKLPAPRPGDLRSATA